MIKFDKGLLARYGKYRLKETMNIIFYLTYKPLPKNKGDLAIYRYSLINWNGLSYLANPEELLNNWENFSSKEVLQYIFAAARRSLADYEVFGDKTLSIYGINVSVLQDNRLLKIAGDKIYFKYEELENGIKI